MTNDDEIMATVTMTRSRAPHQDGRNRAEDGPKRTASAGSAAEPTAREEAGVPVAPEAEEASGTATPVAPLDQQTQTIKRRQECSEIGGEPSRPRKRRRNSSFFRQRRNGSGIRQRRGRRPAERRRRVEAAIAGAGIARNTARAATTSYARKLVLCVQTYVEENKKGEEEGNTNQQEWRRQGCLPYEHRRHEMRHWRRSCSCSRKGNRIN
jgi:hypothetical protein